MLAIAFTLAFALYIIGPDQFSRFILGFTIPRRHVSLTRSEEVSRALVWAVASLSPALVWCRYCGPLVRLWDWTALDIFYSGLYNEAYFHEHSGVWFASVRSVFWLNISLLWRVYVCTGIISLVLSAATHHYGRLRRKFRTQTARDILASVVLPRIAPWHVLLSEMLLTKEGLHIHLDVLTKSDGLYQGRLVDKVLGADNELVSITLGEPKRFQRREYMAKKEKGEEPKALEFWKVIPTNMFLIMGSEIETMNFRYLPESVSLLRSPAKQDDLDKVLKTLSGAIALLRKSREQ